jgi:hypothetical protein
MCEARSPITYAGLVLLFTFTAACHAGYSGGTGEPNSPFEIGTVADWQDLMDTPTDWDKHFVLTADLDVNGVALTPVGNDADNFIGVFDGNDHIIRNVDMNMPGSDDLGLFGYVASGASIRNTGVECVAVAGNECIGGLAGVNYGSISNCHAIGWISGDGGGGGQVLGVGGLVGGNRGSISNCYATGSAVGNGGHVGGLAGSNRCGNISNCYSTGLVTGSYYAGGLVGYNWGDISDCYASGSVSGDSSLGGLAGLNYGSISDSCSTGSVSGSSLVGGLVGHNDRATVVNCYATGAVSGDSSLGGLVGRSSDGIISNCYSTGAVSSLAEYMAGSPASDSLATRPPVTDDYVGGLVGYNNDGSITDSHSSGFVSGNSPVGGLVGRNMDGSITNCNSTGWVSGADENVGGLVGYNRGSITYSYATASVDGNDYAGGLVGYNENGSIINCYATGAVDGNDYVGGLMGYRASGSVINCYTTGSVRGDGNVGGLAGYSSASPRTGSITSAYFLHADNGGGPDNGYGEPLSDIQMRQQDSFVGWDFVGESANGTDDIWSICEGTNYPRLVWQIPAADWICPDGVGLEDFNYFGGVWGSAGPDPANLDGEDGIGFGDLMIFCELWLTGR